MWFKTILRGFIGVSARDVSMFVKITINNRGEKDQSEGLVLNYLGV
jgi:hypothetical protein